MFQRLKTLDRVTVRAIILIVVAGPGVGEELLCSCVGCYHYLDVETGVGVGVRVEENKAARGDETGRNM